MLLHLVRRKHGPLRAAREPNRHEREHEAVGKTVGKLHRAALPPQQAAMKHAVRKHHEQAHGKRNKAHHGKGREHARDGREYQKRRHDAHQVKTGTSFAFQALGLNMGAADQIAARGTVGASMTHAANADLVAIVRAGRKLNRLLGGYASTTAAAAIRAGGGPPGSVGYALKMAVSQGVKRGLFSNEAGMGSTPHAHAMAKVKHPHEQGVVAMTGVFIDTFVVLTMTALVVISTLYAGNGILSAGAAEGVSKANMAQLAFGTVLGSRAGSMFVAVCLLFFAFSTILSWNFFGRLNVSWLLGEKAVGVYSVLAIGFIFLGSCLSNDLVWELADLFNQLMVLPNVLALVTLGGLVAAACRRK